MLITWNVRHYIIVFSLPIRDGNPSKLGIVEDVNRVFSLPIRDGNPEFREYTEDELKFLAYL